MSTCQRADKSAARLKGCVFFRNHLDDLMNLNEATCAYHAPHNHKPMGQFDKPAPPRDIALLVTLNGCFGFYRIGSLARNPPWLRLCKRCGRGVRVISIEQQLLCPFLISNNMVLLHHHAMNLLGGLERDSTKHNKRMCLVD